MPDIKSRHVPHTTQGSCQLSGHSTLILPDLLSSGILKGVLLGGQVDARVDGGLLLELYTRDGVGDATMISTDFYEGIRRSALLQWCLFEPLPCTLLSGVSTDHSTLCGVSMSILPRRDLAQACVSLETRPLALIAGACDCQLTVESAREAVMPLLGWSASRRLGSCMTQIGCAGQR